MPSFRKRKNLTSAGNYEDRQMRDIFRSVVEDAKEEGLDVEYKDVRDAYEALFFQIKKSMKTSEFRKINMKYFGNFEVATKYIIDSIQKLRRRNMYCHKTASYSLLELHNLKQVLESYRGNKKTVYGQKSEDNILRRNIQHRGVQRSIVARKLEEILSLRSRRKKQGTD